MLAYPDYDNCIINLISSIRRYYRTPFAYPTLRAVDRELDKFYKNIVLIIIDGLGKNMFEEYLGRGTFLRRRMTGKLTSVFPSAEIPSYTSCLTGLSPNEHGWLGRRLFFKEFCRTIDVTNNTDAYSKGVVTRTGGAAQFIMPYENIFPEISRSVIAPVQPFTISRQGLDIPETGNYHKVALTERRIFELIEKICATNQHTFTFVRWNEPAEIAAREGCESENIRDFLIKFSESLEELCEKLTDTFIILTSDHGMTDIYEEIPIHHYRNIMDCLVMPPHVEGRAMCFFVKNHMRSDFKRIFEENFSGDFVLLSGGDAARKEIFGRGRRHPKASDFMGDYVACAISDKIMRFRALNEKPAPPPKADCGGLTEDEMIVPLVTIPTKLTLEYRPPMLEDITPNINYY